MKAPNTRITMIVVAAIAFAVLTSVCVKLAAGGADRLPAIAAASGHSSNPTSARATSREEQLARQELSEFLTEVLFPGPVDIYLASREFDAEHPSLANVAIVPGVLKTAGTAFLKVTQKDGSAFFIRLDEIVAVRLLKPAANEKTSITMRVGSQWGDEKAWENICAERPIRYDPQRDWSIRGRVNIYLTSGVFDTDRPSFVDVQVYKHFELDGSVFLGVSAADDKSFFRVNLDRIAAFKALKRTPSTSNAIR